MGRSTHCISWAEAIRGKNTLTYMRFYPPMEDTTTSHVPTVKTLNMLNKSLFEYLLCAGTWDVFLDSNTCNSSFGEWAVVMISLNWLVDGSTLAIPWYYVKSSQFTKTLGLIWHSGDHAVFQLRIGQRGTSKYGDVCVLSNRWHFPSWYLNSRLFNLLTGWIIYVPALPPSAKQGSISEWRLVLHLIATFLQSVSCHPVCNITCTILKGWHFPVQYDIVDHGSKVSRALNVLSADINVMMFQQKVMLVSALSATKYS